MTDHTAIYPHSIELLCPTCKATLAERLGFGSIGAGALPPAVDDDEEWEYAELGLQAARVFLLKCNPKTRAALEHIVAAGESFSLRDLERKMGVEPGGLRGVWTGLTKRTRTITGDPDANLINWSEEAEDGDYIGKLVPMTRDALNRALAE